MVGVMKNYPVLKDVALADDYCLILTFEENEKRLMTPFLLYS